MNIVFQSGEFYNADSSFWTTAFGALIGTLTALIVFVLQVKHDRKKEKEHTDKLINQKLHYFSSMVESIVELAKIQSNHLKVFYEDQRKDTINMQLLTLLPDNDLKRFSEIQNHEEYYHAYLTAFGYNSETVKEYRKYYARVDFLYTQTNLFKDMLQKSTQFDYERKVQYKEIIEKAMDETAFIFNRAKQSNQVDDFANFLSESLLKFYSGEINYSDLNEFQTKFVDPVKIGIIEKFGTIEQAMQLAFELKKATYLLTDINVSNSSVADDFEKIYTEYKNVADKLAEDSKKLTEKYNIL